MVILLQTQIQLEDLNMPRINEIFEEQIIDLNLKDTNSRATGLYTGEVLANNDPQQMHRCRVQIHGIDEGGLEMINYRWVPSLASLAGVQQDAPMGPAKDITPGFTSYGTFGAPKIGSIVLIMFIGGRLSNPIIVGSLYPNDLITGLPGGNRGKNEFGESSDNDITRLVQRLNQAFGTADSVTKDTRGFEVTARAPGERTGAPDVRDNNRKTGNISGDRLRSGYPEVLGFEPTEGPDNEPMMYSYTTPGQNMLLMNDDPDNFKIRIKTLSGNQVILDDTNERIYISTSRGNNYIEMDEDGHIDIYASHRVSIHSEQDINIKSDKQVNIEGSQGINLKSGKDINIQTSTSICQKAGQNIYINPADNCHIKAGSDIFINAAANCHIDSGISNFIEANGGTNNIRSTGDTIITADAIQLNGPPATAASPGSSAGPANSVNRSPLQESNTWRAISAIGIRSDAVSSAHSDKSNVSVYENAAQGGKNSINRLDNWRP